MGSDFRAPHSLTRLLLGLALISGDELQERVREWEAAHPAGSDGLETSAAETDRDRARYGLIGFLFQTSEAIGHGALEAARLSGTLASLGLETLEPLAGNRLTRWGPLRRRINRVAARAEDAMDRWVQVGRIEETRSRELAAGLVNRSVNDTVAFVGNSPAVGELVNTQVDTLFPAVIENPQIEALIQTQLGKIIEYLRAHPEQIAPLVQAVGDDYIAYLNKHPEDVQDLVQGQSLSLAGEIRDEMREKAVTADSVLETIVRSLLHKTPREALPEPPPQVQVRAEWARLPTDPRLLRQRRR
jgi:hypothetical protein